MEKSVLENTPLSKLSRLSSIGNLKSKTKTSANTSKQSFGRVLPESSNLYVKSHAKSLTDNFSDLSKTTNKIISSKVNNVVDLASNTQQKSYTIYIIIFLLIIVLSFIGINVFIYLAYGTEVIKDFSKPLVKAVSNILLALGITTTDLVLSGTKSMANTSDAVVKTTSDNVTTGLTGSIDEIRDTLNNSKEHSNDNDNDGDSDGDSDESSVDGKNYCYVGKHKNKRYCTKIHNKNKCMSGDIYSTLDKCINPNIR